MENIPDNYIDRYTMVNNALDAKVIYSHIFIDDVGQYDLHKKIFDIIYGYNSSICDICPRKYVWSLNPSLAVPRYFVPFFISVVA